MYEFTVPPGVYSGTVLSANLMQEPAGEKRRYVEVKFIIEEQEAPPTRIWLTERSLSTNFAQAQLKAIGLDLSQQKLSDLITAPGCLEGMVCETVEVEEQIMPNGRAVIRVNIMPARPKPITDAAKVADLQDLIDKS